MKQKISKIRRAVFFAEQAHRNQKRKNGKPYFSHCQEVYKILSLVTKDENILCAALLHDVVEDTKYESWTIKKQVGKKIADIVQEVTKDKQGKFHITSKEALMVKLADMLHNISDSTDQEYIKKKMYFITDEIAMPLDYDKKFSEAITKSVKEAFDKATKRVNNTVYGSDGWNI